MNLNSKLRGMIIDQFKAGRSMMELAHIYDKKLLVIEGVIREKMREGEKQMEIPTGEIR